MNLREYNRERNRARTYKREDMQLLKLLLSRRNRLEHKVFQAWDRTVSHEIDLVVALEERVVDTLRSEGGAP